MGIRFHCPQCQNRLHVKAFLAGKRGVCPKCGAKVEIPTSSELAEEGATAEPVGGPPVTAPQPARGVTKGPQVAPQPTARTATLDLKARPRTNGAHHAAATPEAPPPPADTAAATDPLRQAPHSVWYVRPPSGGQFGPARADVMQQWLDEGRVTADCLVWREGWPDWRVAKEVLPSLSAPLPGMTGAAVNTPPLAAAGAPQIVQAPAIPAAAAASVMRYQKKKRARRGMWTAAVVLLSLLALVLIATLVIVLRR